jgi:hypothetical protein
VVAALALTAFSSLLIVAGGPGIRLMLALAVALLLITIALSRPVLGIAATFAYLVFLAAFRRLLIAPAGWISADPLLLVGPLVALVLIVKLFVLERRPWAPDLISKLVLAVLVLTCLEVANPAGGGVVAGLAGLLFMAVPMLWFFVGREVLSDRALERLLAFVVVLSSVVACYGLWQTQVSEPRWDTEWLNVTGGYTALNVGTELRAFGPFSSSSEYALFLGAALAVAFAFVLRGRLWAAVPIPLLAVALFLSSARGALVTAALAVVVLVGLRTGRALTAAAVTLSAIGLALLALHFASPTLSKEGGSSSALVSHEIGGITEPLNPNSSTLLVHVALVVQGVESSVSHPLGQGTAVTNNAAGVNPNTLNTETQATEVDISNAFVALGAAGALYLLLVLVILGSAARSYLRGRTELFPVIALLVVGLGQWLIGGDYALSPLAWLLIGAVAARSRR